MPNYDVTIHFNFKAENWNEAESIIENEIEAKILVDNRAIEVSKSLVEEYGVELDSRLGSHLYPDEPELNDDNDK